MLQNAAVGASSLASMPEIDSQREAISLKLQKKLNFE